MILPLAFSLALLLLLIFIKRKREKGKIGEDVGEKVAIVNKIREGNSRHFERILKSGSRHDVRTMKRIVNQRLEPTGRSN